jgi:hypothetical protein
MTRLLLCTAMILALTTAASAQSTRPIPAYRGSPPGPRVHPCTWSAETYCKQRKQWPTPSAPQYTFPPLRG